nr:signal peptidase I [Candidatus Bathyarchaeota archaeon]NIU81803.1 signal peptidase I [Candidatus Bathyarchaeota archaeon]NIV68446.1 signal peptidase I [Candidatus Bathyarchaeota archaeon]NIW34941.1 signal peptidase I [Candidatus Bathyarchaeota archaeon]
MSLRPEHRRVMIQLLTVLIIFLLVAGVYLGFQVALATTTPWVAVASGSMRPALEAGDLVIVKGVPATDIEVGDIIIFDSPRGVRTIHRVTRIQTLHNGTIQFKTKGDANPSEEL